MDRTQVQILHIEDDHDMQKYINILLEDFAKITHAETLKSARELLAKQDFDLLIIDFTLPDGSGSELVTELTQKNSSVPIIIFSSHEITNSMFNVEKVFVKGRFQEESLINTVQSICRK